GTKSTSNFGQFSKVKSGTIFNPSSLTIASAVSAIVITLKSCFPASLCFVKTSAAAVTSVVKTPLYINNPIIGRLSFIGFNVCSSVFEISGSAGLLFGLVDLSEFELQPINEMDKAKNKILNFFIINLLLVYACLSIHFCES